MGANLPGSVPSGARAPPSEPSQDRREARWTAAIAVVAVAALGTLAALHPGLRFVDFIGFSGRAHMLLEGRDLVHPLYPVGYPAVLLATRWLTGDVLVAGKVLAVLAGAGAALAVARLLGPWAALWLLAQGALLEWGATEGTDMAAVSLALGALAAAHHKRPVLSGALAGAACLVRYTAVAVVPVALLLAGQPLRFLAALLLSTAPHWGLALALGRSPFPEQSYNLAIAAGRPAALWSLDTLQRWPRGLRQAVMAAASGWPSRVAAAGLLWAAWRRDRRAWALLGLAGLHCAVLGLAFANPRLALPATLALSLGAAWLLPRWWLAVPALALGAWNVWQAATPSPSEIRLDEVVAATADLPGPFLSSSPWFYQQRDGWIIASVPLREAGTDPRSLSPAALLRFARDHGFRYVAVEPGRVQVTYPGLTPLLRQPVPEGYTLATKTSTWRVYEIPPPDAP